MIQPQIAWAKEWLGQAKKLYIDGQWQEAQGERQWSVINPANQETLCQIPIASETDVDRAAQAARRAFAKGDWRTMPRRKRAWVMRQMGQLVRDYTAQLATLETLPNGKLFTESVHDDLPDSGDIFDYYAGWIDKHYGETCPVEAGFLNYTVKEPVGVCGLIVPWNFPLLLACWKLAPALATGNTVVIKPSEHTSFTLLRFIELIDQHLDLPPGTINVVTGDGTTGEAICRNMAVNKVSFTGSTTVGRKVLHSAADSNLKTVTLELGGKSPDIFFADTPDLEAALTRSHQVMFSQKGEKCSEPTRFFIHEDIYDQALARLIEMTESIRCGDPFAEDSQQGAQCHRAQFEKVLRYIEIGLEEGAKLVAGGKRDVSGSNEQGFFVRPTIFTDVDSKMRVAQDEIFGPVLVVTRFSTEEEVIRLANDTRYGLAAGLWTKDISRAQRVANQLDAGMVFVNRYGCYDFSSPFGGFRQSGWGKEMARDSLDAYTKTKSVWIKF